jgi:hypothetical protein
MEEMLTQPSVRVLFSSNNAAFAVYEFVVPEGWGSQDLQDVLPESQYHVLWYNRAGSSLPGKSPNSGAGRCDLLDDYSRRHRKTSPSHEFNRGMICLF